jgi:long-chain acyl-CoA synthetase
VGAISQPEFLRPPLDYPRGPYGELLTLGMARNPEAVAVVARDVNLTYRELDALVNRCARGLRALGVAKGDRVCLFTPNCPEYIITFYAAARIGAVVTPMNPSYREREVEYQLRDSGAAVVVAHGGLVPLVEAVRGHLPALRHVVATGPDRPTPSGARGFASLLAGPAPVGTPAAIAPEDLLALPYSSGTTGLPKGVMLSHRNLVTNNVQAAACLRVSGADRLLLFLPFYHIYGAMLMGLGLYTGAALVLMERWDPVECMTLIRRHRVTLFFVVPPVLLFLANWPELERHDLSSLRLTMIGAAPVPPDVSRRYTQRTGIPVVQGYGMTEASPLTHLNPPYDPALNVVDSAGLAAHDTEVRVVDLDTGDRVLAPGETGEICIRGPQVMQGYWQAPEATAAVLRDGWYHTGDIGYVDDRGYAFIKDRKKEMIKFKGFGIAPAEIEALLLEHPGVADAAVIGKPDREAGEVPKAFVVRKPTHAALAAEELIGWARERLAGYKTLHEVTFVEAIPKNPSGKILRRVLKERELQAAESDAARPA